MAAVTKQAIIEEMNKRPEGEKLASVLLINSRVTTHEEATGVLQLAKHMHKRLYSMRLPELEIVTRVHACQQEASALLVVSKHGLKVFQDVTALQDHASQSALRDYAKSSYWVLDTLVQSADDARSHRRIKVDFVQ